MKLDFKKAFEIYSMRWAIEVCTKEEKSLLGMDKCQSRHFAAQIAHISITCLQYNFLSVTKRFSDYETIGELFRGTKEDALEMTIAERILDFVINVAAEFEDEFDCDTDKLICKLINKPESKLLFVKIYEKVVA